MIKKSALAVLAVTMGFAISSYAQTNIPAKTTSSQINQLSMSVNQRLNMMQKRIDELEANAKADQAPVSSKDIKIAKMQKQIAKLQKNDHNFHNYFQADAKAIKADKPKFNSFRNRGPLIALVHDDAEYGNASTFGLLPNPSMPLNILQIKSKFGSKKNGYRALVFGGEIETDTQGWWGSNFKKPTSFTEKDNGKSYTTAGYNSGVGVYLTTADLDVMANINKWTQTYMVVAATQNSIDLEKAFITFGNLKSSPFFVSIGKSRVPFGTFAGGAPEIGSLTQTLFRPGRFTNITFSYYKDGLNTNLSVFAPQANNGALDAAGTPVSTDDHSSGDFMYSVFYNGKIPNSKVVYGVNAGYFYNIANADIAAGQQLAKSSGVSGTVDVRNRQDRNSLLNFEGNVSYNAYALFGGVASTTMKKDYTGGNRAGAWYLQAVYSPKLDLFGRDRTTTFAVAYNGAYDTQNIPIALIAGDAANSPTVTGVQKEVNAYVQREVLAQTYLGLEYGWLGMYDGAHTNEVTLDTSIYF